MLIVTVGQAFCEILNLYPRQKFHCAISKNNSAIRDKTNELACEPREDSGQPAVDRCPV